MYSAPPWTACRLSGLGDNLGQNCLLASWAVQAQWTAQTCTAIYRHVIVETAFCCSVGTSTPPVQENRSYCALLRLVEGFGISQNQNSTCKTRQPLNGFPGLFEILLTFEALKRACYFAHVNVRFLLCQDKCSVNSWLWQPFCVAFVDQLQQSEHACGL